MLIIDMFAGGGGASRGIEMALGRSPDIAVNHDRIAIEMHKMNHPLTRHYQEDVWKVPPRRAVGANQVGVAWFSPDCTHHSRAKGSAPKRDHKIRSLAWVAEKWAREVNPRAIFLENVGEFEKWGPLDSEGQIVKSQIGTTFNAFIRRLKRLGYRLEVEKLVACDYGAPTSRERLFMIARNDRQPIVWPEPTHGSGLTPHRTAGDIIDWSIPCPSIFDRKKPYADNTLKRIAKGIFKYVLDTGEPYIVPIQHYNGSNTVHSTNEPLRTITASPKGGAFAVVVPHMQRQFSHSVGHRLDEPARAVMSKDKNALVSAIAVPHISRQFGQGIGSGFNEPVGSVMSGGMGKSALVTAFMAQHNGGFYDGPGRSLAKPISTITGRGTQQQIVTSHMVREGDAGSSDHAHEVAFLLKYYGTAIGESLHTPIGTVTTKDRFGLVTVMIQGEPWIIVDIGMRMLSPRELFRAQGFDDSYIIDFEYDYIDLRTGKLKRKRITKTDQVRMCGNSVSPPNASAIVAANAGFMSRRLAEAS